jgi:ribosomal protein S18 acetylase RimI-like enzyme
MTDRITFYINKASLSEIEEHLRDCDADFIPPLSQRIDVHAYASKIKANATRFEAWRDNALVGLAAMYCNNEASGVAYITNVSVLNLLVGQGIARRLVGSCIEQAKLSGAKKVSLDVGAQNLPAARLYEKLGFSAVKKNEAVISMDLYLETQA